MDFLSSLVHDVRTVQRERVRTVNQGAVNNTRTPYEARRYYYTTPLAPQKGKRLRRRLTLIRIGSCVCGLTCELLTHASPPISPTHIISRTYKSKLGPIRTGKESQSSRKTLLAKKKLSGYRNRFKAQKTPRKLSVKCEGALEKLSFRSLGAIVRAASINSASFPPPFLLRFRFLRTSSRLLLLGAAKENKGHRDRSSHATTHTGFPKHANKPYARNGNVFSLGAKYGPGIAKSNFPCDITRILANRFSQKTCED